MKFSSESQFKMPEAKQEIPLEGSKVFEVEGQEISVNWFKFEPEDKEGERITNRPVVFLPGLGAKATHASIKDFCQGMANNFRSEVIVVDTRAKNVIEDSLDYEAKAIEELVKDEQPEVVIGNSQGGIKAINFASRQGVKELVLLEGMGLQANDLGTLQRKFNENSVNIAKVVIEKAKQDNSKEKKNLGKFFSYNNDRKISEGINLVKKVWQKGKSSRATQLGLDVFLGIAEEQLRSAAKGNLKERTKQVLANMSSVSQRAKEVKANITIISGVNDPISNPKKILQTQGMENENPFVQPRQENSNFLNQKQREKLMRGLFPVAASITFLTENKWGLHGSTYLGAEEVSRVVPYIVKKHKRENKIND